MKWISIEQQLPEPNVKVRLSYGLFGIRGTVCDDWITTGWLTKSGVWSIKQVHGVTLDSKPTHWQPLTPIQ